MEPMTTRTPVVTRPSLSFFRAMPLRRIISQMPTKRSATSTALEKKTMSQRTFLSFDMRKEKNIADFDIAIKIHFVNGRGAPFYLVYTNLMNENGAYPLPLGVYNRLGSRTFWLFLFRKMEVAGTFLVLAIIFSVARSLSVMPK